MPKGGTESTSRWTQHGLVLAFISGLAVSISSLMTKLATGSTFLQITFFRTLLIGCSTSLWWLLNGHWMKVRYVIFHQPIGTLAWLLVRSISSFTAMVTAYAVYQRLPMGDASAIFGATPIFTGLMGVALLGEAWQRRHIYLTILAWTGIAFIYKPRFLVSTFKFAVSEDAETRHQSVDKFYMGVALVVPVASSLSFVLSRKLSQSIPPSLIIFITSIGVSVYSWSALMMTGSEIFPPFADCKFLVPEVIAGLTSQTLIGKALQRERAAPVTLMRNSSILFSFVFQYVLFGTIPGWSSVVGAVLIITSTAVLGVGSSK